MRLVRLRSVAVAAAVLAAGAGAAWPDRALAQGQAGLAEIERKVERDHPGVATMPPEALEERLAARDATVLLVDVREPGEYAVSRIPGAVRIDPGATAADFRRQLGDRLAGRTVVLYCSVGVRSSRLAERVGATAREAGAAGIYNLRGGIFSWANHRRPLAAGTGPTPFVHPYNRGWSRYLDQPEQGRYEPAPR